MKFYILKFRSMKRNLPLWIVLLLLACVGCNRKIQTTSEALPQLSESMLTTTILEGEKITKLEDLDGQIFDADSLRIILVDVATPQELSDFKLEDEGWVIDYSSPNELRRDTTISNRLYTKVMMNTLKQKLKPKTLDYTFINKAEREDYISLVLKAYDVDLIICVDKMKIRNELYYSGSQFVKGIEKGNVIGNYSILSMLSSGNFGYSIYNPEHAGQYRYDQHFTTTYNTKWTLLWINRENKKIERVQRVKQSNTIVNKNSSYMFIEVFAAAQQAGEDFGELFVK